LASVDACCCSPMPCCGMRHSCCRRWPSCSDGPKPLLALHHPPAHPPDLP
jgi:hypothetical protein